MDQPTPSSPFRPYQKLVSIRIRGKQFHVPENNFLLRAFQFLCPEPISYGRYCWNEDCQYCRVAIIRSGGQRQQALSCKLLVEEGLEVEDLSAELLWNLRSLLDPRGEESAAAEDV